MYSLCWYEDQNLPPKGAGFTDPRKANLECKKLKCRDHLLVCDWTVEGSGSPPWGSSAIANQMMPIIVMPGLSVKDRKFYRTSQTKLHQRGTTIAISSLNGRGQF